MKKIYTPFFVVLLIPFLSGCSKDILKPYDERIEGSWRLDDIDRVGIGWGSISMPFQDGVFTFSGNGRLEYSNGTGGLYNGSWDIRRDWVRGNCYTDDDGRRNCDDRYVRTLQVSAVNFQTQDMRSEFFNEIVFTGTNRFNAYVHTATRSYVFRFRRQ